MLYPVPLLRRKFRFVNAVDFDGINDRMLVADAPELNFGVGSFAVSMWLKPDVLTGNIVTGKLNAAATNGWYVIQGNGGAHVQLTNFGGGASTFTSPSTVPVGVWTHVVVVRDVPALRIRFYINGVAAAPIVIGVVRNVSNAEPAYHGHTPFFGATRYYNGQLDELTWYNDIITQQEATFLYASGRGNAPISSMLTRNVGRWSFDSYTGALPSPVFADLSGNGNTATGQNFSVNPLVPH